MHLGKFKKTDANKKILLHTRYPIAWIHISVTNCIKHFISLSFHTKILVLAKKLHIVGNTVCKCICIAWCIIRIKKNHSFTFCQMFPYASFPFWYVLSTEYPSFLCVKAPSQIFCHFEGGLPQCGIFLIFLSHRFQNKSYRLESIKIRIET